MRIRKIELHGFKTFSERATVLLDHPITGVVGPNGCGKSNIVDAIRWCMGEQSAKTLRGDSMESVIFWGSQSRGPLGMAEVALTFENTGGLPPEYSAYPEIVVSRRLYRDGSSEYLINKTPVRLRDVVDLFLGTGVGKAAYSIIEQGRIGQIVSARPEDLRAILEEAAGVTKYRLKKKAAERRIEATKQNLARVADILAEIDRQVGSLKRQAEKAKRYAAYRGELKDLDLWAATFGFLRLRAEIDATRLVFEQASAKREALGQTVGTLEAKLDAVRLEHTEAQQRLIKLQGEHAALQMQAKLSEQWVAEKRREAQMLDERAQHADGQEREAGAQAEQASLALRAAESELAELVVQCEARQTEATTLEEQAEAQKHKLAQCRAELRAEQETIAQVDAEIARAESTLESLVTWRADLEKRLGLRETEWKSGRERLNEMAATLSAHQRALTDLRSGQATVADQQSVLRQRKNELSDDVRTGDARVDTLRQELHRMRSQLSTLREIEETHEGLRRGVRAVLRWSESERKTAGQVRGLVADIVESPPEYEVALEAALGDRLESVIVDNQHTGFAAIEFLKQKAEGRSTFVPMDLRAHAAPEAPVGEGVRGPLLSLVRAKDEYRHVAQHLLSDVVLVDDLPRAYQLWQKNGAKRRFVTPSGEVVESDGVVSGGSREEAAGVLGRKRRIRELTELCAALETNLAQEIDRHVAVRGELAAVEQQLASLGKQEQTSQLGEVSLEKDLEHCAAERSALEEHLEAVAQEMRATHEALRKAEADQEAANAALARAKEQREAAHVRTSSLEMELGELMPQNEEALSNASSARVVLAEARAHREAAEQRLAMVDKQQRERVARAEELARAAESDRTRSRELRAEADRIASELGPMAEQLSSLLDAARQAELQYQTLTEQQSGLESELRALRGEWTQVQGQASGFEMQVRELGLEMRHLQEQVRERNRVEIAEVLGDYHMRALPGDEQVARAEELRRLIERMGEVNLAAIEELEALSKRREQEAAQKADLEKAVADLASAITQTNRTCRKLFQEAFDAVNERLGKVFQRLFRGGRAELLLVADGDQEEQGVEIVAQPPGKKLESIRALSGGEKALTAVSLLFAIFLYRPSPFCLLDEVDAPLDEANVGRFCEMLREMAPTTQFVLITHNQRTMEIADVLYGVTAEEPGVSKIVSVNLRHDSRAA